METSLVPTGNAAKAVAPIRDLNEVKYVHFDDSWDGTFQEAVGNECLVRQSFLLTVFVGLTSFMTTASLGLHNIAFAITSVLTMGTGLVGYTFYKGAGGLLPPKARAWFRANRHRRDDLLLDARLHNEAFRIQQHQQKLLFHDPERLEALCASWEVRRAALQAKADAFVARLTQIAQEERGVPAPPTKKERIREYRDSVKALLEMERSLDAYDPSGSPSTCDMTMFVAAAETRRRLEERHDALVAEFGPSATPWSRLKRPPPRAKTTLKALEKHAET